MRPLCVVKNFYENSHKHPQLFHDGRAERLADYTREIYNIAYLVGVCTAETALAASFTIKSIAICPRWHL